MLPAARSRSVEAAISSILRQTRTYFEFVIVDNASKGGTADLIEKIAVGEPRIRLLRNAADLGHSGGLNRGLEVCHGR
jgi:glycosyltransferase involved in cell wall biosynthesis